MMWFSRMTSRFVVLMFAGALMLPSSLAAQSQVGSNSLTAEALGVGDVNADVVFTPVTPCRLIDTRLAQGAFPAGGFRSYNLIGPSSYSNTGGNPAGCNIPASTTPVTATTYGNTVRALVLSFTATESTGNGNLRAWPTNQPAPLAAVVTYAPGIYAVANGVAVATCNAAVAAGDPCPFGDLTILAESSATHIVVDVLGYYTAQRYFLASNRTLQGVFAVDFVSVGAGHGGQTGFSFHPPLQAAPTPNLVAMGGGPTANCPGTAANPQAAPGHLCVYVTDQSNVSTNLISKQLGTWAPNAADPIGATYFVGASGVGRAWSVGVWAVTAP